MEEDAQIVKLSEANWAIKVQWVEIIPINLKLFFFKLSNNSFCRGYMGFFLFFTIKLNWLMEKVFHNTELFAVVKMRSLLIHSWRLPLMVVQLACEWDHLLWSMCNNIHRIHSRLHLGKSTQTHQISKHVGILMKCTDQRNSILCNKKK